MRNRIQINGYNIIDNKKINVFVNLGGSPIDLVKNNPSLELLTAEGNNDFINYIEWLGFDGDPNLVVLSSVHHYYYDVEEMKNVRNVVNLIELNQIKQIRSFLHSVYRILSTNSNFIGCFVDNKKSNGFELRKNPTDSEAIENGIVSRNPFLNMIYSIMDSRVSKYMSKRSVTLLLENHGFKVLDMTELNGLTYFHAQKLQIAVN
jgi:hypothetical protein